MKVPDELSFTGGGIMGSQAFSGLELIKKPWKTIVNKVIALFHLINQSTYLCIHLGLLSGNYNCS